MIKPGDRVKMKYYDRYAYGEVTIVSEQGIKVLFDGDFDLPYWYYKPEEIEELTQDELATEASKRTP